MDYEERYNELIDAIKVMMEANPHDEGLQNWVHDNVPELTESEDERIRKRLIDLIYKVYANTNYITCVEHEQIVAWLEKQGEHKSVDKVEPKFQNGQWVVWQNKCYKVNYNGCGYELIDQNGLTTSCEYGTIDESAHLWTIEDAKPGDVLAMFYESKNYILIYRGLYEKSFKSIMSVFCFLEEDTYYDETDMFHIINREEIITPATREQRDTLERAITNAGYRWDKRNLKLENI